MLEAYGSRAVDYSLSGKIIGHAGFVRPTSATLKLQTLNAQGMLSIASTLRARIQQALRCHLALESELLVE